MRRVVVTGMGAVTPFGFGVDLLWDCLLKNKNGITKINDRNIRGEIVQIAGCLPEADIKQFYKDTPELCNQIPEDDSIKSFFAAVHEALTQANLDPRKMESTDCIATCIADRKMSFIQYIDQYAPLLKEATDNNGFNNNQYYRLLKMAKIGKHTPFDDSDSINHFVARNYHITGPQLSIATACASGNNAIGEAFLKIKHGYVDIAIVGGAYNFDLSSMIGFTRLEALTRNPDPETACRPFDAQRDGFVMGSGCGILILESFESAETRAVNMLAEVLGYGYFSDAYRSTDPDPEAKSSTATIKACLEMAKINPSYVGYINAHGTSTKMNDMIETIAIKNTFKDYAYSIPISSTKSMIGHSIMASAAIEGIVCIKSINEGAIHPTRNWQKGDPKLDLDYVPNEARSAKVEYALSNSFGFGGQNTSILYANLK
ncbi:beta-ketoacyl-[acyl-carrier-protein] synthase family protein [Pelosinus baikalensis]|uniref:Beta-ketoacyl-[acyl-carrier-protein] synthase family protein n=1 Tax=Pelosinus baikalensis TaxID=2892015 RepID=A0ABS8I1M9_9FIRM|nr:beta-ketoacyl-[acyl-carrier-protein] synthase family protein [Pelosinus baikalensis]MCC5468459.1 beta-ketoacyl-[acyl-carrier-protein] synthase family protein [Pelosinus baikalensis]